MPPLCARARLALTLLALAPARLLAEESLKSVDPFLGQVSHPSALDRVATRGYATLEDCYRIAATRSERVGRAEEALRQARLVRTGARGVVLPKLTFEDTYYRQERITLDVPVSGGTTQAFSFDDRRNQALIRLEQPIFGGFRDWNFLASARESEAAARHGLEDERRLLYADIAQAFYSALQREGEVRALEDSVEVQRERYREIQARHAAGLARKTEVLLVHSQLATDESRLLRAGNDLASARDLLDFLLAAPLPVPLRDDLEVPGLPREESPGEPAEPASAGRLVLPVLEEILRDARERRSDLKRRERAVEAARYQVAVARGEYYPTLGLEANAILDRTNYSEFAQETDWTAELTLSFPLFDGGRTRAGVATARSRLHQAVLDRDELLRQIEVEVRNTYLTLQSDAAQLRTLEVGVASAEENDRLVREEYRAGLATNLEVITGQNQLLSARLDWERQRYQVKLDWVALQLAQGRLVPESDVPGGDVAPVSGPDRVP
jgi:outer membrane protein